MSVNRIKFLVIILIFMIPFIISYFLMDDYSAEKEWSTTNYGSFVDPIITINNINIENSLGEKLNSNVFNGRWTLIYHLKNNCLDDCLKNIYLLRQIHTALGKDMNRLQRVLISNSESEIDISKSYPGLTIIKNKPDKLSGLLNNISSKTSILLVDPLGNVILRYDNKFEGKKLLKEIKKLFKLSRIG